MSERQIRQQIDGQLFDDWEGQNCPRVPRASLGTVGSPSGDPPILNRWQDCKSASTLEY